MILNGLKLHKKTVVAAFFPLRWNHDRTQHDLFCVFWSLSQLVTSLSNKRTSKVMIWSLFVIINRIKTNKYVSLQDLISSCRPLKHLAAYGSRYSRMHQIKFCGRQRLKIWRGMVCLNPCTTQHIRKMLLMAPKLNC